MNGNDDRSALIPAVASPSGGRGAASFRAWAGLNDWAAWALLVNGILVALYLLLLPGEDALSGTSLPDRVGAVLLLLALELQLVLAIVAWRTSTASHLDRRRRVGWRLFALACLSYWIGNLLYFYIGTVLGEPTFPSLADAGYLAFYPLTLAGLLCFAEKVDSRLERAKFWLDALIVMVGIGALVWYFLLQPLAHVSYASTLARVLALCYPVADTLLMFGVAMLLLRHRRSRSAKPLAWLVAGLLVHFLADTSFAYQTLQGSYQAGGINGALYNTAYFLMLVGAHLEYRMAGRDDFPATIDTPGRFTPLPYLAVALGYGMLLFVSRSEWGTSLGGLIFAAMVLTGLVVGRQLLSVQEIARLRGEQAARDSEARFSSMVRHSSDVICLLGPDHVIRFVSFSAQRVYGYAPEALHFTPLPDLIHPEDRSQARRFLDEALSRPPSSTAATQWRLLHSDGGWRDIETIVTNLTDDPAVGGLVLNSCDVTERKLLEGQLRDLAFHDPLTLLANRTLFRIRVEHALMRTSRSGQLVTVFFLDLDNFKTINDSIGHAEGDTLLKETAARLLGCSREQDTVARLGGDEFAMLIEEPLDEAGAARLAERIADAFVEPVMLGGREVTVTTSIGIAQGSGSDVDALLRNADVAMYAVKNRGKRGHAIFEPGMHAAVVERIDLETDLARAVERGEFRLVYQPIVDLQGGDLAGVEALLRWHHPQRGVVPPTVFIPLAEENSALIVQIGRWVLREACRQGKAWETLRPSGRSFHISVNISVRQLQYSNLAQDVATVLAETGLDPRALVLEITESALMHRTDTMLRALGELKASGVRLAIDDFGMGYSSLGYLHRFPVDILKIDKTFIDRLGDDPDGAGLASAIIALGDTLRLQTVAEGVEHASQAKALASLGCRFAQGYYFSTPVTPLEIEEKWFHPPGEVQQPVYRTD